MDAMRNIRRGGATMSRIITRTPFILRRGRKTVHTARAHFVEFLWPANSPRHGKFAALRIGDFCGKFG